MSALRWITCGSVDDGKSTLIGRLLMDSQAVLQDQLAGVQRAGQTDLALLTDGLTAEREQGITIDVAWRYFASPTRKFIMGDAPGHEQYTRNMVTAASQADAAVVLVDATKIDGRQPELLAQTRRHSLLAHLLGVPSLVFAINKLDAVEDAALVFANIAACLRAFASSAGFEIAAVVPISALHGHNVVTPAPLWCGYSGSTLLQVLEQLPPARARADGGFAMPVQWVEKFPASSETGQGRRIFWGRLAQGVARVGDAVRVFPGARQARISQVLDRARQPAEMTSGWSAGLVLDREVDVSRGDWLVEEGPQVRGDDESGHRNRSTPDRSTGIPGQRSARVNLAWMDDEPLVTGRSYWALHGHRWVKARVSRLHHRLDIHSLEAVAASALQANAIGQAELLFHEELPLRPFAQSRNLGALVLVDTATHRTAGAALVL